MHTISASQQRARARREQLKRRRMLALTLVVTLMAVAVWAAYAIPGGDPAIVPENAAAPALVATPAVTEEVVVARVDGIEMLLPVAREATTAVAFHPVDNVDAVSLKPSGKRASGGSLGQKLADVFAGGGEVQYYLMEAEGSSPSTAGLDVGAVPGSTVVSPLDGKVVAMKKYRIFDRYEDVEVRVQLSRDPSLLLVVTHLARPKVVVGDTIARGETVLGEVRGFPTSLDQALSRYTSDAGDHVQLMVLRITPDLAGS